MACESQVEINRSIPRPAPHHDQRFLSPTRFWICCDRRWIRLDPMCGSCGAQRMQA